MGNFPQKVRKATCGFEPRGSFGVPLRAAATLMTFSSCARNQWGEGSPRPSSQCRVKRTASSANQAPPERLKGANFVCVETRLLDGSRDSRVHEYLLRILMQVVSPFFAFASTSFAIALQVLTKKASQAEDLRIQSIEGASFFGRTIPKLFVHTQKHLLPRFGNPCDIPFRSSGITRSPHKEKEVRKEHECYSYRKGNRGNRYGNLETSPAGRKRYPGKLL